MSTRASPSFNMIRAIIFRVHFCRDLLDRYGVRLNVLGKRHLLPPSVQEAVRKAEEMTCKNDKYVYSFSKNGHLIASTFLSYSGLFAYLGLYAPFAHTERSSISACPMRHLMTWRPRRKQPSALHSRRMTHRSEKTPLQSIHISFHPAYQCASPTLFYF